DETLLDAGLRQELPLPFECRNGGCGVCKCTVLAGDIDPGIYQPSALTAEELAQGKVLLCCATARGDAEIEYTADESRILNPVREFAGRVIEMDKLSRDVMRVRLALPAEERIQFKAGQYINIILDDGERRAFSF